MGKKRIFMIIVCVLIFIGVIILLSYNKDRIKEELYVSNDAEINNSNTVENIVNNNEETNSIEEVDPKFGVVTSDEAKLLDKDRPTLSITINKLDGDEYWMDVSCASKADMGEVSGYELYRSTSKDGKYELINTRYYGTANAGFGYMEDKDTMYYYKAREFVQDDKNVNNKTYTEFSNIVGPVNKDYKNK